MNTEEDIQKNRLGRGLAALLGDVGEEDMAIDRAKGQRLVPTSFLKASGYNPRKLFTDVDLDELASSIKERGILQPILVRNIPGEIDQFEIIAGERRWKAAQKAGLHEVPVILLEVDDKTALEIAVIENVQRADLNPMEEASGYAQLMKEFEYTQDNLAQVLGKSRSYIANSVRLLKLPEKVQEAITRGVITAGHARALLSSTEPEALAERIEQEGLTVRDVERMSETPVAMKRKKQAVEKNSEIRFLEEELSNQLGLQVSIEHGNRGGKISIRYRNDEQFEMLIKMLGEHAQKKEDKTKRLPSIRRL